MHFTPYFFRLSPVLLATNVNIFRPSSNKKLQATTQWERRKKRETREEEDGKGVEAGCADKRTNINRFYSLERRNIISFIYQVKGSRHQRERKWRCGLWWKVSLRDIRYRMMIYLRLHRNIVHYTTDRSISFFNIVRVRRKATKDFFIVWIMSRTSWTFFFNQMIYR